MKGNSNLAIEKATVNHSGLWYPKTALKSGTCLKNQLKQYCVLLVLLFAGSSLHGQNDQKIYGGLGMGLDYGGIFGGKIEYMPVKNVGLFGGAGYNLLSAGWNVGAIFKISPEKNVSPNLMVFYGYNGVTRVEGFSDYEMTSYGVTFGGNLEFSFGSRGNKFCIGLFVPLRSQKFMDNYDAMKNDSNIEIKNKLLPIAFGFGYNILINKKNK